MRVQADERSPDEREQERISNCRNRASHLEDLARARNQSALHRQAGEIRNWAQGQEDQLRRRRGFAKTLPAGQVPAVLLGPHRVGPSARGQLSSGRPQGAHRTTVTACGRGTDEPAEPEPGEPAHHDLLAAASLAPGEGSRPRKRADAASLDLTKTELGYTFLTCAVGSSSPLFGLRVVEVPRGLEAPMLIAARALCVRLVRALSARRSSSAALGAVGYCTRRLGRAVDVRVSVWAPGQG